MKRIILSVAFVFAALTAISQENVDAKKKLYYGFNIGMNYTNIQADDNPFEVIVRNNSGLTMNALLGYHFTKNWSLQTSAGLSFHKNQLYSRTLLGTIQLFEEDLLSNSFDFTFQPTYTFNTKGNKAPYILFGAAVQIPTSTPVLSTEFNGGTNLALELGLGCNVKFSEFTFAPEVRYSYGLNNVTGNPTLINVNFHSIKFLFNFKS